MKIGEITYGEQPLFLAPMENYTDPSFRHACKLYGADMVYTEFVASEALVRDIDKSLRKLTVSDGERPVGIQLYGHNIEAMVESAKIAESYHPDLIDINCGCPVKKIATRGAGAGLLQDIPKMVKMAEAIVKSTSLPVTLKTRLGWDDEHREIVDIAERLQDVGIQALAIHGRTRAQLYRGVADWTLIGEVKNNPRMHIPIIGNGDVDSPQKAKDMFDRYGVDGVMIGRAVIGRPWIFKEVKHYLQTGELLPPPSVTERVELSKAHLKASIDWKGERTGILEMRSHFAKYFKGLPNFKEIRLKLVTTDSLDQIYGLLDRVQQEYRDHDFSAAL